MGSGNAFVDLLLSLSTSPTRANETDEDDMCNVIEMKRQMIAQVSRFGHIFRAEYMAGPTREQSDRQAAFYCDGKLIAWLQAGFHLDDWGELYLQPADENTPLLSLEMLGLPPHSENENDAVFMLNAEMYIVGLLNTELARKLIETSKEPGLEEDDSTDDSWLLTPLERGARVVEVWHNHERHAELLPQLVAIEIYDALDVMGFVLAKTLDEADDLEPGQCGEMITHMVATMLSEWHSGEFEERDNDKAE